MTWVALGLTLGLLALVVLVWAIRTDQKRYQRREGMAIRPLKQRHSATAPNPSDMAYCEGCGAILPAGPNMGWLAGVYECASCRGKIIGYTDDQLGPWHGLPH